MKLQKSILLLTLPLMVGATEIKSSIGKGLSSFDNQAGLKDRCINLSPEQVYKESVRSTKYRLELVRNKEELFDKIEASVSAGGSYDVFSASAKASFVKEIKWNYNSNYILVSAKRVTHRESISAKNILLSKSSKNLYLDSKIQFLESCGNKFAKTVEYGGEIFGVIEITSTSYQEKQKIQNSLEASGGFDGLSANSSSSYKRTIEKLTQTYRAKVKIDHIGGRKIEIPSTVEGLLDLSSKIEDITDSNPVAVSISTREYTSLANFEHDNINYETIIRQEAINQATTKLNDARSMYSKLLLVLEYPGNYKRHNRAYIKEKLSYFDNKILDLKEFLAKSYSFLNELDEDVLNIDLDVQLPSAKRTLFGNSKAPIVKCETKKSPLCGVKSYKSMESSACNVLGVNKGTGPSCGTVYKKKETLNCGVNKYKVGFGLVCGKPKYKQCHHKACGKKWDGSRKRCRHRKCGVQSYKSCRDASFGVEKFNSCRHAAHGVEKFLTCEDKAFGYKFSSCQHLSHGPSEFNSCNVAKIGNQTTFCPSK